MARKPEIQYIRYYTDGSAARQVEIEAPKKPRAPLPKVRKQKKLTVYIQPLAVCGIVAAVVMLVMMISGAVQLSQARQEAQLMRNHLDSLAEKNAELLQRYETECDLESIEQSALALGMIPGEDAQQMTIRVPMPEPEAQPTFWESVRAFFSGLFA